MPTKAELEAENEKYKRLLKETGERLNDAVQGLEWTGYSDDIRQGLQENLPEEVQEHLGVNYFVTIQAKFKGKRGANLTEDEVKSWMTDALYSDTPCVVDDVSDISLSIDVEILE